MQQASCEEQERGRSSVVELLLPKQVVEGSNPFARSSQKPALEANSKAVAVPHHEAENPLYTILYTIFFPPIPQDY